MICYFFFNFYNFEFLNYLKHKLVDEVQKISVILKPKHLIIKYIY